MVAKLFADRNTVLTSLVCLDTSQNATLCFAGFGVLSLFQSLQRRERPKAPEPHPQQHTLIVEGSVLYLIYVLIIFKE